MSDSIQQPGLFDEPEKKNILDAMQLERPLIVFDLETTGLDIKNDRIVQFAFLRVNPDRSQDEWMELVNPGVPIPVEASRVHHITDDMVADKPHFNDFAPMIQEFLQDGDLCGFNIARFDAPFLQAEMKRAGVPLDLAKTHLVDAQIIFHKNEPRDLTAAYRFYCSGEHVDAHDAMGDVRATLAILDAQLAKYSALPKSAEGLHKYCLPGDSRFVTRDRKFIWKNGEAALSFGKHKGKMLKWLVEHEPDYLQWMQNGDFTDETRQVIMDAFRGIFPSKEKNNKETESEE